MYTLALLPNECSLPASFLPLPPHPVQITTRLQRLHEKGAEVNSLYRQLKFISLALEEAKSLLKEKQTVIDVRDYMGKCKVGAACSNMTTCGTIV